MAQPTIQTSLSSLSPYPSAHLDVLIPQTTPPGLGMEPGSLYPGMSPEIASNSDINPVVGSSTSAQKITLLTRSHNPQTQQPPISTSPLGNRLEESVVGQIQPPQHPNSFLSSTDSSPPQSLLFRRGDSFYDSEDPSVNLHEFIVNSLQAQKNRVILLQLEEEFLKYVSDPTRTEPLKLPSWDSYHRMLAHRVAAYFGLDHNVDPQDKTRVVVSKSSSTRIPQQRFADHIPVVEDNTDTSGGAEPKLILRRMRGNSGSEKFDSIANPVAEIKTYEEREEEYEKARARIFSSSSKLHETGGDSLGFDLFGSPSITRSALRSTMAHRRTFSDTAFINKLFSQKDTKQGPSSSGNSPSHTPALSAFFPPTSPSTSPPPIGSSMSGSLSNAINSTIQQNNSKSVEELSPHSTRPQKRVSRPQPPTFMHLYSTSGTPQPTAIPVVYHPHTTIMDPYNNYYNHMVLYPVSPQATGYPFSPLVQSTPMGVTPYSVGVPVNSPYSVNVPAQRVRMPSTTMVTDHVTSPTHPGGVVYRPVPQQLSGGQVKTEDYGSPSLWSPQPSHSFPAFPPSTSQVVPTATMMGTTPGQLADQMEKTLTIGESDDKGRGVGRIPSGSLYGYQVGPNMEPILMSPTGLTPPTQYVPLDQTHQVAYPSTLPMHASDTPPAAPAHMGLPIQPQGMFSPPSNGGVTHSPIQILGHSLSTSILSPPPSAVQPQLFMNAVGNPPGKGGTPGSPIHAPVGSGARFRRFESPKVGGSTNTDTSTKLSVDARTQYSNSVSPTPTSDVTMVTTVATTTTTTTASQQLPPRLAQRGGGGGGSTTSNAVGAGVSAAGSGTRYQNQRHPSNRPPPTKGNDTTQYSNVNGGQTPSYVPPINKREPLLPTPSEMAKLDIGITAGVPVHIMEVLHPPAEDTQESINLIQQLKGFGVVDFKRSWVNRHTEIMVVTFDSPESAIQGLKQCVLPAPTKLSIPLPTHAKHILQLLANS